MEAVTRGGKFFRQDKHSALCALYAPARRIDDTGDCDLPPVEKLVELASVRKAFENQYDSDEEMALR